MPPLSVERWRALSPYLDEALDIAHEQRPAWLATIGARDAALAADLRTLLAEHDAAHRSRFLERPVLSPCSDAAQAGQTLGAYRLVSQFRRALVIQRRVLGARHPVVATTLNSLARTLVEHQRYDEAASALQEALDIARAALPADHQLSAIYSIHLASVQLARNKPAEAEALLRQGIQSRSRAASIVPGRRRACAADDWSVGSTKSLLGAALLAQRRFDEAEAALLDAHRELSSAPQPRSREIDATIARLVELYHRWNRPDLAAAYRALKTVP
jgi:tetratricopeptide (TPR) repeat protein